MGAFMGVLFGVFTALVDADVRPAPQPDLAHLGEALLDRQDPRAQSQAALLLVQMPGGEADKLVRQGLQSADAPDVFLALASALRLTRSTKYADELLVGLKSDREPIREAASEALAVLSSTDVILKLQRLAEDSNAEMAARQTALLTLGKSGKQLAAAVLLDQLSSANQEIVKAAADSLVVLTGQDFGVDIKRWRGWWQNHKEQSKEDWLEERLAYQTVRARRLAGELERTKVQVGRLHEQLHGRLPMADRLGHAQALAEQEQASLRLLAATWAGDLLAKADAVGRQALLDTLLRLSRDPHLEVQRAATLALGKVLEGRVVDRLNVLLRHGQAPVRAAAARSLTQLTRSTQAEAVALQRELVPALQELLRDPALEVVVEAAEDLGTLGVPEAGPVLTALLRHPSEPVRQTAAGALERVADAASLGGLLEALNDPSVTVRFSLVGAVGHAVGDGKTLAGPQTEQLIQRLEEVMRRDVDPGVRSRAATVLGDFAPATVLPFLWRRVLAAEDPRVQEKAWAAALEIILRQGKLDLLQEWDRTLRDAGQGPRRLMLLGEALTRWQKAEESRALAKAVVPQLIDAQLEEGKWSAALPLVRDVLTEPETPHRERAVRWLLTIAEQADKDGKRSEARQIVQEAKPLIRSDSKLSAELDRLARKLAEPE
jgi:HEAT repeat protein